LFILTPPSNSEKKKGRGVLSSKINPLLYKQVLPNSSQPSQLRRNNRHFFSFFSTSCLPQHLFILSSSFLVVFADPLQTHLPLKRKKIPSISFPFFFFQGSFVHSNSIKFKRQKGKHFILSYSVVG
jgi:hypothetical protein